MTYWNTIADAYQQETHISTDDFHYGPLLPGDRELHLLPDVLEGLTCLEVGSGADSARSRRLRWTDNAEYRAKPASGAEQRKKARFGVFGFFRRTG